jgi:selenocysteine-specific elongation factor
MAVVATAGHVDHGKSTLVRLLTGMEPDRWAAERERGLTIDLGYAWTDLEGRRLSLVDVPGHEHFTGNMLAGLGPVGAVMFVVAADDGWCPQSQEHARAIAALGIAHVLLVVTRCDLVDGARAEAQARQRFAELGVPVADCVHVSGRTGDGLPALRTALAQLAAQSAPEPAAPEPVPEPGVAPPVRLWLDRSFSVRGAGTVVTGTLSSGTLRVGDVLVLRDRRVAVRGLQTCGEQVEVVTGPSRVAVNLRGVATTDVSRGDALLAASWPPATGLVDVRGLDPDQRLPRTLTLHVGTAALPVRTQRLGDGLVRLRLDRTVPLLPGDRAVLRDPGLHEVLAGIEVAVVDPPTRRDRRRDAAPVRPGPVEAGDLGPTALMAWLAEHPLEPPTREQLDGWGLTPAALASAAEDGGVFRTSGLVLAGDALARAEAVVRVLDQPFTVGEAARAMGTSRRVAVPLLERLDAELVTRRRDDGTREVREPLRS